jgi:CRP/FNR family cyclic AMP-dependent transcriptional regulator
MSGWEIPDYATLLALWNNWEHKAELIGYVAALLTIGTYSMKTMIPLRVIGICANFLFILYGYFAAVYPQLLLHAILLPLNSMRLYQMMRLVTLVNQASNSNLSMEWIKSFTHTQVCRAGETVFNKGDKADKMYYIVSGRYLLVELGIEMGPGEVVGEIGLVSPKGQRTQTFRCLEDGELLAISYAQVKQLYFQNPRFGFYFLRLMTQRLLANNQALEQRLAEAVKS